MTLCTLPPPINLLTQPYHSTESEVERRHKNNDINDSYNSSKITLTPPASSSSSSPPPPPPPPQDHTMNPTKGGTLPEPHRLGSISAPRNEQMNLPSFKEFISGLPEDVVRTVYSPPSTAGSPSIQPSGNLHTPRPAHARSLSGRHQWHPYSPPASHRSNQVATPSRTPSPAMSERSSNADSNGPQPRSARPTYTEEEIYFIWYHRDDLGMGWNQVLDMFNNRFGKRERNGVQGIQCRYYRALEIHRVPKSRARDRSKPNEMYGVRQRAPEKWWSWMQQQQQHR